ncbi:MAG: hypothetical protein JNK10_09345, partial [Cyclobacteriaceae bacterium]|nr:hypothetical protein [Cyclobacteriaceae bacterium]
TRAHSMGLFSYGGRLVTSSPVMDINIQYDRKTWGFQLFKAMDLRDSRTPINFCLAAFNKNFHIGKKITVTPSVGVILEEYESIADHGSDAAVILTTAYKMNRHFTLEHSTLAGNLVLEPNMRDWVNRLRLLYSFGHLDVTLMGWHNNRCFDDIGYFTYGSSVFYSRAKLSPGLSINAGITGLVMAFTSNEAVLPPSNGVFLTLAVVVDQKTPFN